MWKSIPFYRRLKSILSILIYFNTSNNLHFDQCLHLLFKLKLTCVFSYFIRLRKSRSHWRKQSEVREGCLKNLMNTFSFKSVNTKKTYYCLHVFHKVLTVQTLFRDISIIFPAVILHGTLLRNIINNSSFLIFTGIWYHIPLYLQMKKNQL